ncbi:MAG: ATP-binding cassette domain-containing protein [Anaerococcus sp.]|uniref:ATP-binding cassette domain-containing protein n=1 Tax=Anaerococcus sp. TaxID=1872515 RepID=UPI00261DF5E8|nr:ATP-binding cassette domain-containing protein [Anaerococcus sp.]MCI5971690.1 ATP-binding cassette domain-containing protein [Anaerococcus sp.]MDD6918304.1 ATP-binding cassette domain-containing protein [Peptoniphilaceae bacterium]MDY2927792.1 ATP-binding cassette domain-containing protein [Anaerococcus sp.]
MKSIEIKNLNKSYGNRNIINDLSFDIDKNEIVALIGKSGSGKSTVLNMIGLLETIDSGEIKIKSQILPDINSKKAMMIRRNTINYLFQSYALINHKTVLENLLISMEYTNLKKSEKLNYIRNTLKDLGIDNLIESPVNTLSGGEAQRVSLARCIVKPGDIILADEPTGSLDPNMSHTVFDLLLRLRENYDKTILIVTHDMDLAKNCDRVISLNK